MIPPVIDRQGSADNGARISMAIGFAGGFVARHVDPEYRLRVDISPAGLVTKPSRRIVVLPPVTRGRIKIVPFPSRITAADHLGHRYARTFSSRRGGRA